MKRFSTTMHYIGNKKLLVNGDRVLYVERLENPILYVVHFDNGETLEIEETSGKILIQNLEQDSHLNVPPPQVTIGHIPNRYPRRARVVQD